MNSFVPARKYLSLACALAALVAVGASPALSKTVNHVTALSSRPLYSYAPEGGSAARDEALHDCNVEASKFSSSAWQSAQITTYRVCMFEHGVQE